MGYHSGLENKNQSRSWCGCLALNGLRRTHKAPPARSPGNAWYTSASGCRETPALNPKSADSQNMLFVNSLSCLRAKRWMQTGRNGYYPHLSAYCAVGSMAYLQGQSPRELITNHLCDSELSSAALRVESKPLVNKWLVISCDIKIS